jgi:hypothetical protein
MLHYHQQFYLLLPLLVRAVAARCLQQHQQPSR